MNWYSRSADRSPGLMLALLATMPGTKGRAADRITGVGAGTAARHQRAGHVARIERLALRAMTDPRCMTERITDWRVAVMREIDGEARLHHFTTRPE